MEADVYYYTIRPCGHLGPVEADVYYYTLIPPPRPCVGGLFMADIIVGNMKDHNVLGLTTYL